MSSQLLSHRKWRIRWLVEYVWTGRRMLPSCVATRPARSVHRGCGSVTCAGNPSPRESTCSKRAVFFRQLIPLGSIY